MHCTNYGCYAFMTYTLPVGLGWVDKTLKLRHYKMLQMNISVSNKFCIVGHTLYTSYGFLDQTVLTISNKNLFAG